MRTRARGLTAVALSLLLPATAVLLFTATAATADPGDPYPSQQQVNRARAQVAQKQHGVAAVREAMARADRRLESASVAAEMAAERYNQAHWELGRARRASTRAKAAAAAARAKVEAQRLGIAALVTQSYEGGAELDTMSAFLTSDGPEEIMAKYSVAQSAGQSMQVRYDEFAETSTRARESEVLAQEAQRKQADLAKQAEAARAAALGAANTAQAAAGRIAARRKHLVAELARAEHVSVALAARRQAALEQIAAARAAARAKAKAAAAAAVPVDSPARPPATAHTTGSAAAAVAFARNQLGEPYQWAADGPGSWDCSGLTMMAWRAGGVWLPHYSAGQYAAIEHIGVGDLRPGDLVFWGSSPGSIHHVAMYLGDGMIIHAPRTGQPVQTDSMYYWIPPNYFGRP